MIVSPSVLHDLLTLDAENGRLFWNRRPPEMFPNMRACRLWNTQNAGKEAFLTDDGSGYLCSGVFDTRYRAHRVIWAMVYGEWPSGQIDHIDGNRANNKLSNLRDVSPGENGKNKQISVRNRSGVQGVGFVARLNKWRAQIVCNRKHRDLGLFVKFEDAVQARKQAEIELGFSPNHGRAIRPAKAAA